MEKKWEGQADTEGFEEGRREGETGREWMWVLKERREKGRRDRNLKKGRARDRQGISCEG